MKAYHTDKEGIGIWRLSGVVSPADALTLLRSLGGGENGCFIIDFEKVDHINYTAFEILENGAPKGAKVLYSGLNDYVLNIFAFVRRSDTIPVYPDLQKALNYLVVERGKICSRNKRDSHRLKRYE
jgi:hypothetical protein